MAGEVAPHLALPLRFRGDTFVTVEQGSTRHLQDQAEVLIRTRPGTFEADASFGMRNLAGSLGAVGPSIVDVLADHIDGRFVTVEDASAIADRIRSVRVQLEGEV